MAKGSATSNQVKFGEVVRLVKETCKDPVAAGIKRVIGLEHLEPGDLRVRSWNDVADGTTFTTRVRPGQVLFGKRRAYQRKVAVADFDAVCSGDIYVFESVNPERLLPELLPFICQTDAFFEHAVGTSAGSLSPRTNWSSLAEYEVALPSLEKQVQIARQLAAFKRNEVELTNLQKSLDDVQAAIAEHYATGLGAPVLPNGQVDPNSLPPQWTARTIAWLADGHPGCGVAIGPFGSALLISDYDKLDQGTPVLFVGDVRRNRFVYESRRYISAEKHRELAAHEAIGGDVVCNKTGWPPGVTARLPRDWPPSVITSHLVRIRLNPGRIDADYFAAIMNSHWGQVQCVRLAPGTTRPQMTLNGYRAVILAVPPFFAQKAFVEQFAELAAQRVAVRERLLATHELASSLAAVRMASP